MYRGRVVGCNLISFSRCCPREMAHSFDNDVSRKWSLKQEQASVAGARSKKKTICFYSRLGTVQSFKLLWLGLGLCFLREFLIWPFLKICFPFWPKIKKNPFLTLKVYFVPSMTFLSPLVTNNVKYEVKRPFYP